MEIGGGTSTRRAGQEFVLPKDYLGADQLRGFYAENLVSRRDALEVLRLELPDAREETEASIKRIAHTLQGSASVFGFDTIGRAARALETATDGLLEVYLDDLIREIDAWAGKGSAGPAKLLVIEPDPDEAILLELTLSDANRELLIASTAMQAEEILEREDLALILLEPDLPDGDGRNLLMHIRARSKTAMVPVIVLSKWDSAQVKTECLALGADAFYQKPYDPTTLSSSVSVWLQRRTSVDSKDAVTGLPDRVALTGAYERLRASTDRAREPLCVGLLDFDHFASVVDLYGFTAGDMVLRRSTALATQMLRDADVLGRWEGQTFVALFPGVGLRRASELLDRALQTVRAEAFAGGGDHTFYVSISAGLVEVDRNMVSLERAVADAATFLKQAQEHGGGRVVTRQTEPEPVREKILVVEDDEIIARLLVYRLEREGYEVVHFGDGQRAYTEAPQHNPSVVLLDVRMPGMDGFELLERLRRTPAYARVPVMLLTAMGSEYDIVRGFELGADDYVLKPFSPLELVARVRRLLKRRV